MNYNRAALRKPRDSCNRLRQVSPQTQINLTDGRNRHQDLSIKYRRDTTWSTPLISRIYTLLQVLQFTQQRSAIVGDSLQTSKSTTITHVESLVFYYFSRARPVNQKLRLDVGIPVPVTDVSFFCFCFPFLLIMENQVGRNSLFYYKTKIKT